MRNQILLAGIIIALFCVVRSNSAVAAEGEIVKLDKAQFKALIMDYEKNPKAWKFTGKLPVIVDFYADWCGPCRTASPILEELARKYKGKIVVYKVNTDQERELGTVFGISSIPAFLWVPPTGNPTMTSGIGRSADATREQFEKMIQDVLLKK
ncbi:MAG: thioredoxin domain-containing protein [Mariniphaga sp.]